MATVVSASTIEELPSVLELLRGARTCLCDSTLVDGQLRMPFEFMDAGSTRIYRSSLPGAAPGSVPLLRAYLVIDNVIDAPVHIPEETNGGRLDASYNSAEALWILQTPGESTLSVPVSELAVSVTVTDEHIGTLPLRMRM